MRNPVKVFIGVVFVLIVFLLCLPPQTQQVLPRPQTSPPPRDTHQSATTRTAPEERAAMLNVQVETPLQAAMLWRDAFPEQAIRFAALVDSKNVPIFFYGLCLDQDGNPLEGVRLKLGVRQWRGVSRLDLQGVELAFERISDKGGRFELTGVNGDVAGVDDAQKEGYTWMKKGSGSVDFWGRRTFVPTLDRPFILHFWKKRGAEPLYVAQPFNFQPIACNGVAVSYDLVTGAKIGETQNPSIRFSLVRNPEILPQQNKPKFDWQFTVEVPGGMVQRTMTNMAFLAPRDGYGTDAHFGFKSDDPEWASDKRAVFFYKTARGHYGRLDLRVTAALSGPNASFEWTSYLNPSGSPVLEYDPAKRLKPPAHSPTSDLQAPAPASVPPGTVPSAAPPPAANRSAPFLAQPPPGFQVLTNRGPALPPGVPPRPPQ